MSLNLNVPQQTYADFTPRIIVIGVGGGGTNAVENMIHSELEGVEFMVANTDAQQLGMSNASVKVQLGPSLTKGLGAGARPEIGKRAAEEVKTEIEEYFKDAHMVFITAGMGGGTGTGAAPVIAQLAHDMGILTVGVITKPFTFEGPRRSHAAEVGISELQKYVHTLIIIPNQNLFAKATATTSFKDAFKMADQVLHMGVRGVTDLMIKPGMINLDFADIRTIMEEMGKAMMGTGEAEGENRALNAAEEAISNPLLDDSSMRGAQGLLINITGSAEDLALHEVEEAVNRIRQEVAEDVNLIFGTAFDESLKGRIRISVVATGIDAESSSLPEADPPKEASKEEDHFTNSTTQEDGQRASHPAGLRRAANYPVNKPESEGHHTHSVSKQEANKAPSADTVPDQVRQKSDSYAIPVRSGLRANPSRKESDSSISSRGFFSFISGRKRHPQGLDSSFSQNDSNQHAKLVPSVTVEETKPEDIDRDIPAFLRKRPKPDVTEK